MLSFIGPASFCRRCALALLAAALLAATSFAQTANDVFPEEGADDDAPETALDVLADEVSARVANTVDETAAWIDRRFGNLDSYAERSYGYIRLVPVWVQHHGWETETRFRARVNLPNIDDRLHAVFGAGDTDNFISDRPVLAELEEMAATKERFGDRSFLAGLGYSLSETKYSSFRFSGGLRFNFPIEPYVRARYVRVFPLRDETQVRFHQALYARTQRGQGSITGFDVEHILSPRMLARGAIFAHFSTWDERPQEYGAEVSLARALSRKTVVAITGFGLVEPKAEVSVVDYGFRVVYRQRLSKDRLFGEIHTGYTWPKYTLEEERRASLNLGVGLELHFGDRRRH
jgi:hypothetical protein